MTDGKGIYKTGQQILTSKLTTEVGEAATTQVRTLTFNDQEAIAQLEELQQAYPGAEIYVNGELTVDFPSDVKIPVEPNQMVTAELVGNRIRFDYCGVGNAIAFGGASPIALLREQFVVGTVEVKVVQPRPFN